ERVRLVADAGPGAVEHVGHCRARFKAFSSSARPNTAEPSSWLRGTSRQSPRVNPTSANLALGHDALVRVRRHAELDAGPRAPDLLDARDAFGLVALADIATLLARLVFAFHRFTCRTVTED